MAPKPAQPQGIQSLEIGTRVLRAVQLARHPLALKDIARESALSPSQAHRYLTSWIRTGFVEQHPASGNYFLGDQAMALGLAALHRHDTLEKASAQLAWLAEKLGETSLMTVWCTEGPICVRWLRGRSLLGTDAGLGTVFPVAGSAAGLAFAAYLSPALTLPLLTKQAALARQDAMAGVKANVGKKAIAANTLREHTRLLNANRESVSEHGYALARGHFVSGLSAMSAPVFDPQGEVVATIDIIVRDTNLATLQSHYADVLVQAARTASLR
jgi:DNA-binding IclR family transcriptional regulator